MLKGNQYERNLVRLVVTSMSSSERAIPSTA